MNLPTACSICHSRRNSSSCGISSGVIWLIIFIASKATFGITQNIFDHAFGTFYAQPKDVPRSETVHNLGYTGAVKQAYPWVANMSLDDETYAKTTQKAGWLISEPLAIRVVRNKEDKKAFIGMTRDLYADDPNFVQPLTFERLDLLNSVIRKTLSSPISSLDCGWCTEEAGLPGGSVLKSTRPI